jgi:hypothetical protein
VRTGTTTRQCADHNFTLTLARLGLEEKTNKALLGLEGSAAPSALGVALRNDAARGGPLHAKSGLRRRRAEPERTGAKPTATPVRGWGGAAHAH